MGCGQEQRGRRHDLGIALPLPGLADLDQRSGDRHARAIDNDARHVPAAAQLEHAFVLLPREEASYD